MSVSARWALSMFIIAAAAHVCFQFAAWAEADAIVPHHEAWAVASFPWFWVLGDVADIYFWPTIMLNGATFGVAVVVLVALWRRWSAKAR